MTQRVKKMNEVLVHRDVENGILEITETGEVYRLIQGGQKIRKRAETHIKPNYPLVRAMIDSKAVHTTACRLVYFHFFGEIPPNKFVRPKDGDFTNTHPENLILVPAKHKYNKRPNKADKRMKLEVHEVYEIKKLLNEGVSKSTLARRFNCAPNTIAYIASGRNWGWLPEESMTKGLPLPIEVCPVCKAHPINSGDGLLETECFRGEVKDGKLYLFCLKL